MSTPILPSSLKRGTTSVLRIRIAPRVAPLYGQLSPPPSAARQHSIPRIRHIRRHSNTTHIATNSQQQSLAQQLSSSTPPPQTIMGKAPPVTMTEEYVLGNDGTPFYTREYFPTEGEADAYVLFVHGFAEHIGRYDSFFRLLSAAPHRLHITAYDSRGHGKTSQTPLAADAPEVKKWKDEAKQFVLEKNQKHRTGGWGRQLPDLEFLVKRESERAKAAGKKLFLYGHSMGGALSLGFCTRGDHPPPDRETLKLLSGVIVSAPFIRQTKPSSFLQVKLGMLAASLGLGNVVISLPLEVKGFTRDLEIQEKTMKDPLCTPAGSLRSVSDMLSYGNSLDAHAAWNSFPEDLPLLVYHGSEDPIADPKAAVRFGDMVVAKDKTTKVLQGLLHEPHNELAPEPQKLADMVSDWIHRRTGEVVAAAPSDSLGAPAVEVSESAPTPTTTAPAPAAATSEDDKSASAKL